MAFFFFRAEDGIRDTSVTGVQTCALPIFELLAAIGDGEREHFGKRAGRLELRERFVAGLPRAEVKIERLRSEERRVGKECRTGGWRQRRTRKDRRTKNDPAIIRLHAATHR